MRRKEREVTDTGDISAVLEEAQVLHLGFNDNGHVYVVPVNFGWEQSGDGAYTLYVHGAKAGRKYGLIAGAGGKVAVGFELDARAKYVPSPGEDACHSTSRYASIVGEGTLSEVTDNAGRDRGMRAILRHVGHPAPGEAKFHEASLAQVAVMRLDVSELSCKINSPQE